MASAVLLVFSSASRLTDPTVILIRLVPSPITPIGSESCVPFLLCLLCAGAQCPACM